MNRFTGVLFLLVGLGSLVGAGWTTVSSIRFNATAERTVGTICFIIALVFSVFGIVLARRSRGR